MPNQSAKPTCTVCTISKATAKRGIAEAPFPLFTQCSARKEANKEGVGVGVGVGVRRAMPRKARVHAPPNMANLAFPSLTGFPLMSKWS